ncbi:MAG: plasmid mobilization relaxosome protein MobC [Nitrospiraceae bacterium]|nr:plasmid mobilization relaxosome protein MobC [Nitrospiraceae bacterium]
MAKTKRIFFRVSENEYGIIESKIRRAYNIPEHYVIKRRLGDYMRQAALMVRVVDIEQLTDSLSAVRREINHIGHNVNQIAHRANADGYDAAMYDAVLDELTKLREKINNHAI